MRTSKSFPSLKTTGCAEVPVGGRSVAGSASSAGTKAPFIDYAEYAGPAGNDPRYVGVNLASEVVVRIIEVEGPVLVKRVYDIYLRACGIKRLGHEIQSSMNKTLAYAIREGSVVSEDEAGTSIMLCSVVRMKGSPAIKLRNRGPRSFEEIPPSELQVVARYLVEQRGVASGSDEHLRAVLECFELKRLTTQVSRTLRAILATSFPHADEFLSDLKNSSVE